VVFIIEFGAGHFQEITCKVLREFMRGGKSGSIVVSHLKIVSYILKRVTPIYCVEMLIIS